MTLPLLACTTGPAIAQDSPKTKLQSAGTLEFGDKNVLFVGDSKAAVVHAFELRDSDLTSQENVDYGNGKNFLARELISNVDEKLAAFLGTKVDQISINDLVVHCPTKQILMSVSRGLGPDAKPVIVKINKGKFEILELSAMLSHAIRVYDDDEGAIDGRAIIAPGETEWSFTPAKQWKSGSHSIRVADNLEDISGNNLVSPLDVAVKRSKSRSDRPIQAAQIERLFSPIEISKVTVTVVANIGPATRLRETAATSKTEDAEMFNPQSGVVWRIAHAIDSQLYSWVCLLK